MRIQVLHRVSVPRSRVRLSQVFGDRGKDQQDQVVQTPEPSSFPTFHEWSAFFPCHGARVTPLCRPLTSALRLDKTIKLWKVFEKGLKVVSESNQFEGSRALPPPPSMNHLRLPRMSLQDNIIAAIPRKIYSNAHAYHIHSISVNSDQETYISADDLRINLWNLNISNQSFSTPLSLLFVR